MKCNNKHCVRGQQNFDPEALKPCDACIKWELERFTETPDVKGKGERIRRIQETLKHRKDEQE